MKEKQCTKCKIIKPISEFHRDLQKKDKLRCWCKDCAKKSRKDYIYDKDYYNKNREKLLEKNKKYYNSNIKSERKRSKVYRDCHIEECKERCKEHYQNNKDYYYRKKDKRNRDFGFVKLFNNPFPNEIEIDYHHINNMIVIPVPRSIHKSNLGNNHRQKMELEIEKLYGLKIDNILCSKYLAIM